MARNFTAASSQYLSTATAPVTAYPVTIACWFQTTNTSQSSVLVSLQDADTQARFQLSTNGTAVPKRAVQAVAVNSAGIFGDTAINTNVYSANVWYHSAGVFTTTSPAAYFNGVVGSLSGSGFVTPTGIDQILIGARYAGSVGGYNDGLIAEVGIWDAALTADEIAALARGMTCDKIRPQNLKFYAPLVRDLKDVRGGLTITNNNGATVADHPRVYA